jgi:hypothetical protein
VKLSNRELENTIDVVGVCRTDHRMVEVVSSCLSGQVSGRSQSPTLLRDWRRLEWSLLACANNVRGAKRVYMLRTFHVSQVKSLQKQQTPLRKPIECVLEASRGGRESMEMT